MEPRPDAPRTDSLRVAVDVGPLHGHRTGVGTAVAGLVGALAERDDVDLMPYLVSFRAKVQPPQRRLPYPALLARRAWALGDLPRVDRYLEGAHVVHGTNYVVPPSGLPSVVTVYDCWFLAHPEHATPAVRLAARVLRRAVARGATVHVSSHATASRARELLGVDRVRVVPLGPPAPPPPDGAVPPSVAGRDFVLALGTVERRKDIPTLVEAFGAIADERPELLLVIAGATGDDDARVATAVADLPRASQQRVLQLGAVDEREKAGLLRTAHVLAYPSLDEGFGFPLLEAQIAGTPVVGSNAGSIAEVAGDGVELFAPGDATGLATALVRVLDDDARRAQLVDAGRRNVERFSWERTATEMVDLYREVVGDARRIGGVA